MGLLGVRQMNSGVYGKKKVPIEDGLFILPTVRGWGAKAAERLAFSQCRKWENFY